MRTQSMVLQGNHIVAKLVEKSQGLSNRVYKLILSKSIYGIPYALLDIEKKVSFPMLGRVQT